MRLLYGCAAILALASLGNAAVNNRENKENRAVSDKSGKNAAKKEAAKEAAEERKAARLAKKAAALAARKAAKAKKAERVRAAREKAAQRKKDAAKKQAEAKAAREKANKANEKKNKEEKDHKKAIKELEEAKKAEKAAKEKAAREKAAKEKAAKEAAEKLADEKERAAKEAARKAEAEAKAAAEAAKKAAEEAAAAEAERIAAEKAAAEEKAAEEAAKRAAGVKEFLPAYTKLTKGAIVGKTRIYTEYELEFDFHLNSYGSTNAWRSIIHFGHNNGQRLPAIWFTAGHASEFSIWGTPTGTGMSGQKGIWNTPSGLTPGKSVHFKMVVTKAANNLGQVEVFFDGVSKTKATINIENNPTDEEFPIYAGDPWYVAADGQMKNLIYRPLNAKPEPVPEPEPEVVEEKEEAKPNSFLPNYTPLRKGAKIGTTRIYTEYELEFDLHLNSYGNKNAWRSLIHIGHNNGQRLPAIWFTAGHYSEFSIWGTPVGTGMSGQKGIWNTPSGLTPGKSVHFRMRVTKAANNLGQVEVFFDGVSKIKATINVENNPTDEEFPIYVGDPWYEAANAQIKNVIYRPLYSVNV